MDLAPESVQELKEQVFGSQSSTQSQPSQTETTNTEAANNTSIATENQPQTGAEVVTPLSSTEPATPSTESDVQYLDPAEYIKQNFGFESIEAAQQWISNQRELEKNPPKYEPTYTNDESKRWAEYLINGKEDELRENLNARHRVKNIDTLSDEQKIKLYIQMQNPLFDQELVDYQYNREYGFDESQYKDEDGNITDPMAYRFAKIAAQQKLQNDISRAGEYFSQYKNKIDLAPLTPAQAQQAVDEEYENYKQYRQQQGDHQKKLEETLSKISEDKVNYSYKFNDEASKLAFDINFSADKQGFDSARKAAINYFDFLQQNYYTPEGQPMNEKFLRDIYIAQNLDKFAAEIAKQAVNADRKWFLANQKNITDTTQRNYNVSMPDDIQRLKEQVFGKTA